ncbi:MAG: hypothetical protein MUF06_01375 [Pirellulaceae bacterium]|nr:hypothetical protein [Pirellulaceae bacterium]
MSNSASRRYRAPQEDGAALIEPARADVADLLAQNRHRLESSQFEIQGQGLPELAALARHELVAIAARYTDAYLGSSSAVDSSPDRPLIVSGHQPELFHAGVWFKNFLLSSLAERHGATAVNLIIDSDLARHTAIPVPERRGELTTVSAIPLDAAGPVIPFEERSIVDQTMFWEFPARVCAQLNDVVPQGNDPSPRIVSSLWEKARQVAATWGPAQPLGLVLSQARHALECDAGLRTLEVPLSHICQGPAFRRFVIFMLGELPTLRGIYNDSLAAYRIANRVRSASHPVPSLAAREQWLEAPLHLWTTQNPIRRHCFVRRTSTGLELTNFDDVQLWLEVTHDGAPDRAIEQLAAAESRGIKLRPRALVTTLFARVFLSDLFIHGIGGAKYDELTDEIIYRWFGLRPPRFLTATATFRLPIDRPEITRDDVLRSAQRLRDVIFRPESLVGHPLVSRDQALAEHLASLAAEKRKYLERNTLRKARREIYQGLARIHHSFADCLAPVAAALHEQHLSLLEEYARARRLGSREFSYSLFCFDHLVPRLLELCNVPA